MGTKTWIGQLISGWNATTGAPEDVVISGGMLGVADNAVHPGEDVTFDMQWGGMKAKAVSLSADGQVGTASAGYYLGYLVTTALSAAVINVRDATAAGAGTIVDVIPASAAIGAQVNLPYAKYCPAGVYADFVGTGTVTFFYWQP